MPSVYSLEYAKSGRAKCAGCKEFIEDKSLRISVQSATTEGEKNYTNNRHLKCLTARVAKNALEAHGGEPSQLPGFGDLKEEDQEAVKSKFAELAAGGGDKPKKSPAKRKAKEEPKEEDEEGEEAEEKPAKKKAAPKKKAEPKPKAEKPKKAPAKKSKKKKDESEEEEPEASEEDEPEGDE